MTDEKLYEVLGDIKEKHVKEAREYRRARKPVWLKWAAMAACLCLAVAAAIPPIFHHSAEPPPDTVSPGEEPSNLVVDGVAYFISPHLFVSDELPDGFELAGEGSVGGFENCPYYTNAEIPEWIYVYHEVGTNGAVDAAGALIRTAPHNAYVRYVDKRLRGKALICCNGAYYISMWSAETYGEHPDVSSEYYNAVESTYGVRVEGNAPEGFVSAGITEFSGYDTVPRGALVSNEGAYEVYVNASAPDVVYASTSWYTAAAGEHGETRHEGFNVYIRYDCPFGAEA